MTKRKMGADAVFGSFELTDSFSIVNNIGINKYKSRASGLTVVHCNTLGPLVSGFNGLATEAFDDDG